VGFCCFFKWAFEKKRVFFYNNPDLHTLVLHAFRQSIKKPLAQHCRFQVVASIDLIYRPVNCINKHALRIEQTLPQKPFKTDDEIGQQLRLAIAAVDLRDRFWALLLCTSTSERFPVTDKRFIDQ